MRKKIYVLILLLCIIWPMSAMLNSCHTHCDDPYCRYFKAVTIHAVDNADSLPHEILNSAVYAKALKLEMHVSDSESNEPSAFERCYTFRNPFITGAYAMYKKDCYEFRDKHKFKSFSITSNNKFDALHPANSNLADLFYSPHMPDNADTGDYIFYLNKEPADTGTHIFTVRYLFDTSLVFQASTPPIKLLK